MAILKANKVNTLWAQGDQAGAHAAAAEAKKWSIISAILGIVVGIIYFVFCFGMSRYSLFVERRLNAHKNV